MAVASAFLGTIQTGPYLNAFKMLPVVVLLLIWTRLMTWTDKDAVNCHLPREWLNAGNFAGMVLAGALFFMLPVGFALALTVFFCFMLIEAGVYLALRHQKVGLKDLGKEFKEGMDNLFKKKVDEEKQAEAAAGELKIVNKSGATMTVPDEGPERAQYDAAHLVLNEPIIRDAERIEMTATAEGASVLYSVDGVLYEGPAMDRTAAAAATTYLKFAAGLQTAEKRKPQSGDFRVLYGKQKHEIRITTKGSAAGETVVLQSDIKKRQGMSLDELGMSPEQIDLIKQSVTEGTGLVIVAAPPTQGLTTLEYAILRAHDAFLQHIRTVERAPETELEGITQLTLPAGAGAAEEAKEVELVVSQEPDVVMLGN
jgi:type II secretory ATPase GspE/PulE/Tfp pilus assembly ATPase PilB-like protein